MHVPGRKVSAAAIVVMATLLAATASMAATNLLYILDASNSMWGRVGSETKIDTAKSVLRESLATLPRGVTPALMVYGHRQKNDCGDVQLVAPFERASAEQISRLVENISPRGKTPIATALERAGQAFEGRLEESNAILLISDGIETCGGNPCEIARKLSQRGIDLRINVVGFDVDAKARAQLQCIAKAGKGQYFDARSANDFKVAVATVQKQAQQAAPPPPQPKPAAKVPPKGPTLYFADEFNGNALSSDWQVINPDSDNYLVEDGVLTIVAHDGLKADTGRGVNVLRLKKPLPKGDWTITARLFFVPQTLGETFRMGLEKDAETGLYAVMNVDTVNYDRTNINLRAEKLSKGKRNAFADWVYYVSGRDLQGRGAFFAANVAAVDLRLVRKGRKYTAMMRLEPRNSGTALPDGKWHTVQSLSALKAPGNTLAMVFGGASSDYLPHGGEGVVQIDWVKIETP